MGTWILQTMSAEVDQEADLKGPRMNTTGKRKGSMLIITQKNTGIITMKRTMMATNTALAKQKYTLLNTATGIAAITK